MNKLHDKCGYRSIFSDLELRSHGFVPVSHQTFTFDGVTFEMGGDIPCITWTYLIGEYNEDQARWVGLTNFEKLEIINYIKELKLFWIFSVYFGEIYITKESNKPKFHLYVRGSKKKFLTSPNKTTNI